MAAMIEQMNRKFGGGKETSTTSSTSHNNLNTNNSIELKLGKTHLHNALKFIKMGYKQQDIYVELFDEVYQSQIEETLNTH